MITPRGTEFTLLRAAQAVQPSKSTAVMAAILLVLGFFLLYPVILVLINSFNVASQPFVGPREWGLDNWRAAFQRPGILISIGNSFMIWTLVTAISFPIAVLISWALARIKIPFSHTLEFGFWISFMMPGITTTLAWMALLDPDLGFLNKALERLPFLDNSPFNIFSIPGIVWAHIMANGVAIKVMLLTPAFRNMDATQEEAARVSGATNLVAMLRVTLPLMVSPMALVLALQLLRIFRSFEIELLLGLPFNFFTYSTKIYDLVRNAQPPIYGQATALASITLLVVAVIIPLQRWILQRRRYTTVGAGFKPGLIDLGAGNYVVFGLILLLLFLLTLGPFATLIFSSFMTRAGFFNLNNVYTFGHWHLVLTDVFFIRSIFTTLILTTATALISPILFSLIAYILVRTRWRGRAALDLIIWGSGAIPGMLSGLGLLWLFLGTPGLVFLFGSIWALLIVIVMQGNTTGTNIAKGVFVQVGQEMEEAARISGAGWFRTYFRIWVPILMPTLVLLGVFNFVLAAGETSSIVLLASRETKTLALLALDLGQPDVGKREAASVVGIFIMLLTVGVASVARFFGLRAGVRQV